MSLGVALMRTAEAAANLAIVSAVEAFRKPKPMTALVGGVIYVPPVDACAYCGTFHDPLRNSCENCGAGYV